MRITVDPELCDGFGVCAGYAPDLFDFDDDGFATERNAGVVESDNVPAARRAIAGCPAHAIREITTAEAPAPR